VQPLSGSGKIETRIMPVKTLPVKTLPIKMEAT